MMTEEVAAIIQKSGTWVRNMYLIQSLTWSLPRDFVTAYVLPLASKFRWPRDEPENRQRI
jgi:hypothetical protein